MEVRVSVPVHGFILLDFHVVRSDAPLLLGLDILCACGLTMNIGRNVLKCAHPFWEFLLIYRLGSGFLDPDSLLHIEGSERGSKGGHGAGTRYQHTQTPKPSLHYTSSELQRLHINFNNPTTDKLFELLKGSDPAMASKSVKYMLQKITKACDSFHPFASHPFRMRASISQDDLLFNHLY